jgi:hypothetical protein
MDYSSHTIENQYFSKSRYINSAKPFPNCRSYFLLSQQTRGFSITCRKEQLQISSTKVQTTKQDQFVYLNGSIFRFDHLPIEHLHSLKSINHQKNTLTNKSAQYTAKRTLPEQNRKHRI